MISGSFLQSAYVDLYTQVRKYIWEFAVVAMLADLEISVYQTFPDLPQVKLNFQKFRSAVSETASEDEELQQVLSAFSEILESADSIYAKLFQVQEVLQDESI